MGPYNGRWKCSKSSLYLHPVQFSSIQISLGSCASWLSFVGCGFAKQDIMILFLNQQNWFMLSFILGSKSYILNMIFQNNYNQIMEITPSRRTYHSKSVTIFFMVKLNFQRKPCKTKFKKHKFYYWEIQQYRYDVHIQVLQLSFVVPFHSCDSSNIL